MIDRTVFYARLAVCKQCKFWNGVCLKGHVLQGSLGCPVQKFEGVEGAGYLIDVPVPNAELPAISGTGCCGKTDGELKPLTWGEVWRHLMASVEIWRKEGFPVVSAEVYVNRIRICKECPKGQYQWFQCKHCQCIVYSKAKLATEDCPYKLWPQLSVVKA